MRRFQTIGIAAGAVALALLMAADGADAKKKKKGKNLLAQPSTVEGLSGPLTLSNVNSRWKGASARTRINLPVKKGSSKEGWSSSEWMRAEGEAIKMRFSVNRREDLREVLPQKNLLAGVELVCDGWSVQNPKKGMGIQVDFHFVNYTARARAEFNTDLEHLGDVERFLRFNVMAVTRADERLTPASTPTAAATRSPLASAAVEAAASGSSGGAVPRTRTLDIRSAEVRPAVIGAGDEVSLAIEYVVSSGNGSAVQVEETRTVTKGTETVASFASSLERTPGTYTTVQLIRIPPDAPAGFYSFKAQVSFAELDDEFTVLFEVL